MADQHRILVADDDPSWCRLITEILTGNGYHCDTVMDAAAALAQMKASAYDLLIADIKMPGNEELELIHQVPTLAEGMPVILMTAFPSLQSAVQSVQLPVAAYLVKPVDFDELLSLVQRSLEQTRMYRSIRGARERLRQSYEELQAMEAKIQPRSQQAFSAPVEAAVDATFRNVSNALSDLLRLTEFLVSSAAHETNETPQADTRLQVLAEAVKETIEVLEKTKQSFKSKDLGILRKKLEGLMGELTKIHPSAPASS